MTYAITTTGTNLFIIELCDTEHTYFPGKHIVYAKSGASTHATIYFKFIFSVYWVLLHTGFTSHSLLHTGSMQQLSLIIAEVFF